MARKARHNPFRDDKVHVVHPACATCIYRKENQELGIGARVIANAIKTDNVVVCHSTLYTRPKANAVCGGFYAKENTLPVRLAKRTGAVVFVPEPTKK